jgi:hypothetical protein
MSNRICVLPLLYVVTLAVACGGSSPSPTSPGMPGPASGTAIGASISGSVQTGTASGLTSASLGRPMFGLVITVAGTSITSAVDSVGRFTLIGVPSGDVQLQFTGPATGTILVAQVRPAETISLVVSVAGSTVTVESQQRSAAGEEQLEGRVESLPPTMAAGSMRVAGRPVTTDGSTVVRQGGSARAFGDLEIGYRVHVRGRAIATSLLAASIEIQNVITTIPVNVNGVMDSVTGSATGFEFKVGSRVVKGDALTMFFGDGSAARSFADLQDGARVEVKGLQRDGFVYAERIHVNGDDDDTDDSDGQDSSASIHGRLNTMSGAMPTLVLTVGTTTVRTTNATEVRRRGDVQTLAALRIGQEVHVVGTRQQDGSLVARMIQLNDDATGGEVEIQGAAGGVSGTCPSLSFTVNGYSVQTNATTAFEGIACAAVRSGTKVTVQGTSQADNSILAVRIKG